MQYFQVAWLIRYIILGLSLLGSLFVITTSLYGRLNKYLPCRIIFMMQVCFLIVNLNAILYTDRFTQLNRPEIGIHNKMIDEEPWRGLCIASSYMIHVSWMVAYFLSLTLVVMQYWILTSQFLARAKHQKIMLWGSVIMPAIINAAPFVYGFTGFGFGPNGFFIPSSSDWSQWTQVYFYCGWRSPQTWEDHSDVIDQQFAYGFNYMLPLAIALMIELFVFIRIGRVKKLFEKHGVQIAPQHEYITKLHKVPVALFLLLVFNMIIRLLPQLLNESLQATWARAILLLCNYSFDLIPIICTIQFYIFVSKTLDVPQLKFMCQRTQAREKSLLTQKSELYAIAPPS